MADIVDDFLGRLSALVPGVDAGAATRLEQDLRQHWGGGKRYVGKHLSDAARARLIENGIRSGKQLGTVIRATGLSKSTAYRVLGKKS